MAPDTQKSDKVEVMFTDSLTYDGMPYTKGKTTQLSRKDADNLILSGHAVEYTEDLRDAEEKRKELPQNVPLKEKDVIIATHDSGEQVAYPENREKGPLDVHPTPGTPLTHPGTLKSAGSPAAQRLAAERNKSAKGRQVEELPNGDIPTGVPLGVHEAAQSAMKSLKPNTVSSAIDIDPAAIDRGKKAAAEDEKDRKSSKK